jgi:hypothetical protein
VCLRRFDVSQLLPDEGSERLSGGVPPTDAERVTRRVGVHLVPLVAVQVASSEYAGTEVYRLLVRLLRVFDMKVDVYLLRRCAVWPGRGNVPRCQLDADPPLAGGVDHAVKRVVGEDVPIEHPGPECTFCVQVGGVKHHHASYRGHGAGAYEWRGRWAKADVVALDPFGWPAEPS